MGSLGENLKDKAEKVGSAIADTASKAVDGVKSGITSGANWIEDRQRALQGDIDFSAEDPSGDLLATPLEAQALKKAILAVKLKKPDGTEYTGAEIDNILADGLQAGKREVDVVSQVLMQLNRQQQLALRAEIIRTNNAKLKNLYDTSTYTPPEAGVYRPQRVETRFEKELWYSFREKGTELKAYFSDKVGLQNLQEGETANIRLLREQIVLRAKYTAQVIDNVLADETKANGEYAKNKQIDWFWVTNSDSDLAKKLMTVTPNRDAKVQKEVLNYSGPRTGRELISSLVAAAGDPLKESVNIFGTEVPLPKGHEEKRLEAIADILKNIHDGWAVLDPTYAEQIGGSVAEAARGIKNVFTLAGMPIGLLWSGISSDNIIVQTGTWLAVSYGVHKLAPGAYNIKPEDGAIKTAAKGLGFLPERIRDTVWKSVTSNKDVIRGLTPAQVEALKTSGDYLDPSSDTYKERIEAAKKEIRDLFKEIGTNSGKIPRTPEEIAEMERRIERIDRLSAEYKTAWVKNDLNNLPRKNVIDYYLLQEVEGEKGLPRIENVTHIDDPDKRYEGAKRINSSDPLTKTGRYGPVRIAPNAGTATSNLGKIGQAIDPRRIEIGTPTEAILKQAGKAVFGQRTLDTATVRMDRMTAGNVSEPFKVAATIKDAKGRHEIDTTKPNNEYELKDVDVRKQVAEIRIAATERAKYFSANVLHQELAALEQDYQTIQYELEGKDAKGVLVGKPIGQFQEEPIVNSQGNPTAATRKIESPAYKAKMEELGEARKLVSAKKQEIAKLSVELQASSDVKDKLKNADDKIDGALKEIEAKKGSGFKLDFVTRDISGNPVINRTMDIHPDAFVNKLVKKVGKLLKDVK